MYPQAPEQDRINRFFVKNTKFRLSHAKCGGIISAPQKYFRGDLYRLTFSRSGRRYCT